MKLVITFLVFSVFGLTAQEATETWEQKKINECLKSGGSEQFCSSPLSFGQSHSVPVVVAEERRGIILENPADEKDALLFLAGSLALIALCGLVLFGIQLFFGSAGYGVGGSSPRPRS